MGQQAAFRFGQDGPNRITVAPSMLTEASEVMPNEPTYQALVPFLPPSITSGDGSSLGGLAGLAGTGVSGNDDAEFYPGRLDLHWWQGDDVIVRLQIDDLEDLNDDLSSAAGCLWFGEVRSYHNRYATRLYDFSISTAYTPPVGGVSGSTEVSLFIPRGKNRYTGTYHWDLQCLIPADLSEFPKPDDVDAADWPPENVTKTFLYGLTYVVPEVTRDYVPPGLPVVNPIRVVWPNGRVP